MRCNSAIQSDMNCGKFYWISWITQGRNTTQVSILRKSLTKNAY